MLYEVITIAYQNITSETDSFPEAESIDPALSTLLKEGRGAGFPNIIIDNDGVRRRINLFTGYNGKFFAQLVMAPFLEWAGNPDVVLNDSYLLIKGAKIRNNFV